MSMCYRRQAANVGGRMVLGRILESAEQLEQDSKAHGRLAEISLEHMETVADLVPVLDNFPTPVIAFWHGCSRGISRKTAEQRVGGRISVKAK